MVSHLMIMENRYYQLFAEDTEWRHFRVPVIFFNFLITSTYMIPFMLRAPDQDEGIEIVYQVFIEANQFLVFQNSTFFFKVESNLR